MSVTNNFGAKPCFLSILRISLECRPRVAPTLNEHVEDLAFVVDGAPQVHSFPGDPNNQASGAGQLHPRALSEPDVILSHHPAPIVRPRP